MKINKQLHLILLFFILFVGVSFLYSADFYICLGSFIDANNSKDYSISLNANGVDTLSEVVLIDGKYYTRVLYNKKYTSFNSAKKDVSKLLGNKVIKDANIKDLWIRPGALLTNNISKKSGKEDSKKTIITKEVKESKQDIVVMNNNNAVDNSKKETVNTNEVKKGEVVKQTKVEDIDTNETVTAENKVNETKSDKELTPPTKKNGTYKIIDKEGYANSIFASEPIELGKEDNYEIKSVFTKPEKVYARCYFPGPIGEVEPENFWHEIWIDGKLIMKTNFNEAPDPDWDQIQIWITEDEYKNQMDELESGEHEVIIWVMKNEYKGDKAVAEENAAGEIEGKVKEVWVPVRLSKGKFTYIVP